MHNVFNANFLFCSSFLNFSSPTDELIVPFCCCGLGCKGKRGHLRHHSIGAAQMTQSNLGVFL